MLVRLIDIKLYKRINTNMSLAKEKEIGIIRKGEATGAAVELESQFILRLPSEAAVELRRLLRSGAMNIKDRLSIQLENDMRHTTIRFDNWVYPGKIMDLPSILESLKTIDKKTCYKTADICQIMIAKEEEEVPTTEDEESPKKEEKDRTKAEKKNLCPHGISPSLKNVRKRRFRKTLKKKYVDAPEIEKEVKRLFRVDNEAVSVRWEVITDEDDQQGKKITGEMVTNNAGSPAASGLLLSNSQSLDVAEHDIFGEEVSSSDDEREVNIMDSGDDESSRMSGGMLLQDSKQELLTQFTKGLIQGKDYGHRLVEDSSDKYSGSNQDHIMAAMEDAGLVKQELGEEQQEALLEKLQELRQQLLDVQARRGAQELEIASIENQALKNRFQSILESLIEEEKDKQRQFNEIASLLNH